MVLPTITKNQKIIFLIVFTICLFIQVIPVVRSGINYSYGIGFWGPNGHDGIWHLGLINHINNPLKINMPVFAGEVLKNYHPLFDILIAFLSKITYINSSIWLFQIFPIISATLFLLFSFLLGRKISTTFSGGVLLMILNTISNSLGWVVTLVRSGSFNGESLFWAMQSPSNQLNPPFMLSILLILILIYVLKLPNPSKLIIFIVLSLLPIIKVYSAVPAFIYFFVYTVKHRTFIKTFILSLLFGLVLFFQYNGSSTSLIKFQPFWFVNSMIESPDRLYIPKIANARYTLEASGKIGPRLIIYYMGALALFIIGNFAWRLLSIKESLKDRSLLFCILICTFVPILFIQKGTSWNTIQFLYYALFLANIPLSIFLNKHLKLAIIVVALSLLPLLGSLPNYLGKNPPTAISINEQEALTFLSKQPQGTVLTFPYDAYLKKSINISPLPIYAYETSSYVAAYTRHQTYLEDEMNLENSGFDWHLRRENSESFFTQKNQYIDRGFLVNNKIDYLYLPKIYLSRIPVFSPEMYLETIFENPEIIVYKIKR